MIPRRFDARTPRASGRFVLARSAATCWLLVATACASGGAGERTAAEPAFPDPVLERGPITASEAARAAGLVTRAEAALAAGDAERAALAAREVVDAYATAPVSGHALWLLARATRAMGDLREADALAQRFARLLTPGDPRLADVRLLQGSALLVAGEGEAALRRLLALDAGASGGAMREAVGLARGAAATLDAPGLAAVVAVAPAGHPFVPVLHAARARLLYNTGAGPAAREAAQAALASGAQPPEAAVAQGVLDGVIATSLGLSGPVVLLGSVLPARGSPTLREYARLVEEGVRAALATDRLEGRLELDVIDGGGTPSGSAAAMQALLAQGALAVVGPLQAGALDAAAAARDSPVPVISPTSPRTPPGAANVYTLLGPDPGPARQLARWAAGAGLSRVVIVHSLEAGSRSDAAAFADAFRSVGGVVLRSLSYPPGSTNFAGVMGEAAALMPDAVVLPVPPGDVELLAPQVTFYGLDTLGIHVLGTGAWTDEEVLRSVNTRYLDGVVAATSDEPGAAESEGHRRFVSAYESTHRKTLRSPVPALGYDAASLLLEALDTGARTPAELARALEAVDGFQGATGILSVEDGAIVRESYVVCLQNGRLLPVPVGEPPLVVDRRPPLDTLTGQRPVPVGLPFVRVCPGETPPPDGVPVGADSLRVPGGGRAPLVGVEALPARAGMGRTANTRSTYGEASPS